MLKTRAEIKTEAKQLLKNNYLEMVLTALLLMIVTSALTSSSNASHTSGEPGITINVGPLHYHSSQINALFSLTALLIALAAIAIGLIIAYYIKEPVEYSCKSWFRHRSEETETKQLMDVFYDPDLKRIRKTMFARDLEIFFFSLLLIVPGIIRHYMYYFVPQLLEDHPELSPDEILCLSKDMTNGKKMDLLAFDLSFIGWSILSSFTRGLLGVFFLNPYKDTSEAILYLDMINHDSIESEFIS